MSDKKKIPLLQKFAIKRMLRVMKLKALDKKITKKHAKYKEKIKKAKMSLISMLELFQITDDEGREYTKEGIMILSDEDTEELLREVIIDMEKLVR